MDSFRRWFPARQTRAKATNTSANGLMRIGFDEAQDGLPACLHSKLKLQTDATSVLQLRRFTDQLRDALEQTAGRAAVEHAMVEAQGCLLYTSPSPRDR